MPVTLNFSSFTKLGTMCTLLALRHSKTTGTKFNIFYDNNRLHSAHYTSFLKTRDYVFLASRPLSSEDPLVPEIISHSGNLVYDCKGRLVFEKPGIGKTINICV